MATTVHVGWVLEHTNMVHTYIQYEEKEKKTEREGRL